MTLCLAAVCDDEEGKDTKIVLCCDLERQQEGIGASETEDKLSFVRAGWPTLIAGVITKANDLVEVYAEYLASHFAEITEFNLKDKLRIPAHTQKERLVDEYLRQTYAFSREYFNNKGKKVLPESFMSTALDDVSRIKLDGSLIISGFFGESDFYSGEMKQRPFLAVVDEYTDVKGSQEYVRLESAFAAIGTGSYTALSTLYRRRQQSTDSLVRTLYNVYEANRLSEEVPGVGKEFLSIDVLHEDGKMESMTDAGYKYFRALYEKKYGPREIKEKDKLEILPEFLEPFDAPATPPKPSAPDSSQSQKP